MDVFALHDASNTKREFAACLVRLAGHDFMDFRQHADGTTTGGADGCMNFDERPHFGIPECVQATNVLTTYDKFCDVVSLADFIVIITEAAQAKAATKYDPNNVFGPGSLEDTFRRHFKAGRQTLEQCSMYGLMPNPEMGCTSVKSIFVDHIYNVENMNESGKWSLTAAITGAHTLGRARQEQSGYIGTWSDEANQGKFNNDFYKSIILKGWAPQKIDDTHHQWTRVDSVNSDPSALPEMMLNSDMCLAYLHNSEHENCVDQKVAQGMTLSQANGECEVFQNQGEFLNAANVHCCAWTNTQGLFDSGVF